MKTKLLLFLASVAVAHAGNYVGEQTFVPPFTVNEPVNIVGNLTLATPGVYSATAWNVVGNVRLAAPGDYTFTATSGGIAFAGQVIGPASGRATLHVIYRKALSLVGTVASGVTLVDDTKTPVTPGDGGATPSTAVAAPLLNLSTRVALGAGVTMHVGFVVGGTVSRRVLLRVVGPGLAAFGVAGVMADPGMALFQGSEILASNDNWESAPGTGAAAASAGAFALAAGSKDAALAATLSPGAYTIVARGAALTDAGEVLVEVYLVE